MINSLGFHFFTATKITTEVYNIFYVDRRIKAGDAVGISVWVAILLSLPLLTAFSMECAVFKRR